MGDELFENLETDKALEKPHYLGHRARLRQKLMQNGDTALADYEILELLLALVIPRRDVKELAKNLLKKFGSLGKVLAASEHELQAIDGVKESCAAMFKVVRAAHLRSLQGEIKNASSVINSWAALIDYCRVTFGTLKVEEFHTLFLDTKFKLMADEVAQTGTVDKAAVYPREIVKRALELGARSVILVHNHPSGDTQPSKEDIETTKKIREALALVNVTLHDHLIIGTLGMGEPYSFKHNMLI